MNANNTHTSKYFYGNKISEYGLQNGYVDYATLSKSFDAVLNNNIMQVTCEIGYWEQESGFVDNSEQIAELEEKLEELEAELEELEEDVEELEAQIEEVKEQIEELEDEQNYPDEIFQYYIVSYSGASILQQYDEIVFYNEELDMYVWGVTHYGTSWDYVLTNIKLELDEN